MLDDNGRELMLESAFGVACADGEIEVEEEQRRRGLVGAVAIKAGVLELEIALAVGLSEHPAVGLGAQGVKSVKFVEFGKDELGSFVGDRFTDQPLSFHPLLGPHHGQGWVLSIGMVSAGLTIATAAAGHAEPPSPGPVPAVAPQSVDWIQALDPKGLYASFGVGEGWPQPVHYSDDRLGPRLPIRGEVLADPGFASERGLGYDFGRLRGELSWVRRQATINAAGSSWSVGPFRPSVSRDSPKVRSNSGFASLYLDLPVPGTRLIPYLGGGLGFTALETSPTTIELRRFRSTFGGSGNLPAYQAKAGLAYRSSPRTDLFAEAVFQGSPSRSQGSLERSPLINWGLRFGLRWRFGGPVQAVAPLARS